MRSIVIILLLFLSGGLKAEEGFVEFLSDNLYESVVLIENRTASALPDEESDKYKPRGTGVLIAWDNCFYILTANHIIEDSDDLCVRFRRPGDTLQHAHISIDSLSQASQKSWISDDSLDLSLFEIEKSLIIKYKEKALNVDSMFADPYESLLGSGIYVVGYPSSIAGLDIHVVRKGSIAAILSNKKFLIDSQIYPGTSGAPVFSSTVPNLIAQVPYSNDINMEINFVGRQGMFLGIVVGYLYYRDVAVSRQTDRPRVTFEENSGLAVVISAPAIYEFLQSIK